MKKEYKFKTWPKSWIAKSSIDRCIFILFLGKHPLFFFYRFSISSSSNACLLLSLPWAVWSQRYSQPLLSFPVADSPIIAKHQLVGGSLWQLIYPQALPGWLCSFLQCKWLKTCLSQWGKYVRFGSQVMFHVYNGLLIIVSWIKFSDYKDFCFYQ